MVAAVAAALRREQKGEQTNVLFKHTHGADQTRPDQTNPNTMVAFVDFDHNNNKAATLPTMVCLPTMVKQFTRRHKENSSSFVMCNREEEKGQKIVVSTDNKNAISQSIKNVRLVVVGQHDDRRERERGSLVCSPVGRSVAQSKLDRFFSWTATLCMLYLEVYCRVDIGR